MKSHARVVVIGGGIVGCSVLYHLAKGSWSDVVLVEKSELTAGSTWHASGNVPYFSLGINQTRLHKYSVDLYQRLEQETGHGTGFHTTGSLRLATTQARMDEYKHHGGKAKWLGIPYEIIGPSEAKEYYPLLNTEGLLGVVWNPNDGYTDPAGTTMALAKGARDNGATIYRRTPVTGLEPKGHGGWRVLTEKGDIACEHVVLAASFWSPAIARTVGLDLPILAMQHHYIVYDTIPEVAELDFELPVLRDVDASYYVRQEQKGLLIGLYERDARPWATEGIPPDFEQELLPPDLDRLEDYLLAGIHRLPALETAGIKLIVNGPISYTPDGSPLLGPVQGLRNFWLAAGFTYGIVHGGGGGQYLANWIIEGEPEYDLFALDANRFGDFATKSYLIAKCKEFYANEYAVVYPFEERPAGRPAKTTPIYHRQKARGAVFGSRYGWERPNWFAPQGVKPEDELSFRRTNWFEPVGDRCRAVRDRVGILDLSSFSQFEFLGPGAGAFLDRMTANRLPQTVGRTKVCQMLSPRGRILADLTITRLGDDRFYVVTGAASELHDLRWFEAHLPATGVSIDNLTGGWGCLVVAGPRSRDLLQTLTEADLSNQAFPFLSSQDISVGPARVRAMRISFIGELGWELHHQMKYSAPLYEALLEAGEAFGVVDFGLRAMDSMRLEKAFRMWGLDMTTDDTPLEAGLDRFVRLDKDDFVGRDALLLQKQQGLARRLAYITVAADEADPLGSEPVFHEDRLVGYVTSGGYGHSVGQSIAFAYVPPKLVKPGTKLEIEVLGERRAAQVVREPLLDPEYRRLRC